MQLHVYRDAEEVCNALAAWIAALIDTTLQAKEKCVIALSGGETPKILYGKLAAPPYHDKIKWDRVHIFWGDERVVPFTDDQNNAKMACDNFLDKVDIPSGNIHKMWTDMDPVASARQYEKILHQYFDDKQTTFDLILLGMGDDGHTLSLFPGEGIPEGQPSWVAAVYSKVKGERITLLPAVVNQSAAVVFLVTGEKKSKVLQNILQHTGNQYPAQLIQPLNKQVHWFVDETALGNYQPARNL